MSNNIAPRTSINTRGHRQRRYAEQLISAHHIHTAPRLIAHSTDPIRVVCISDTHNTRPEVPGGDVLIHAGDLTENGSFDELQNELVWLASLPHKYKVFVAGNHDVLLDGAFLEKYPERRYGSDKTRHDLDWGDIIYLQDEAITLEFPSETSASQTTPAARQLTIFGSPWTPKYGASAFQYSPGNCDHWDDILGSLKTTPDIVVTHGPPKHHLDKRDFHRAGCPYLAQEIRRIRPRLSVFGHIHVGYGREEVIFDSAQEAYEEVMTGWAGWGGIVRLVIAVAWARLVRLFRQPSIKDFTTLVNAAVVGGPKNELQNSPIVVEV